MLRFIILFLILVIKGSWQHPEAVEVYKNDLITIKADNSLVISGFAAKQSANNFIYNNKKSTNGFGGNNSLNLQLNINNPTNMYFKLTSVMAVGAGQNAGIDLWQQYGFGIKGKLGHLSIGQIASSNAILRLNPAELMTNNLGIVGSSTYYLQQLLPPLVAAQIALTPGLWSEQYGYGINRKYRPKISYISPLVADSFYVGFSYAFGKNHAGIFENGKEELKYENTFSGRNVLQAGIRYIKQISNNTDISAWTVGEYVSPSIRKSLPTNDSFGVIRTRIPALSGVSIGVKLGYLGWQFAGEYTPFKHGKQAIVGAGYAIGQFALGVAYMRGSGALDNSIWSERAIKINNDLGFRRKYKIDRFAATANFKQNTNIVWYGEIFSGKVRCDSECNSTSQQYWCKNYGAQSSWKNIGIGLGVTIVV